jgi:kexin
MFKKIAILMLLLIILIIGYFDYVSKSLTTQKSIDSIEISGTLVDGYIKYAIVCLDINLNGICNNNEKTTITDINGNFKFTNINKSGKFASIIGSDGIDTAINKPLKGQMKTIIKLDSDKKVFVTPVTDIIASSFIISNVKNVDTLNNIESIIANNLGLNILTIHNDPMKDKYIFIKAQEIVFLKSLIKDLSNEDDIIVSNSVSKSFLNKLPNEYINILEIFKNMNVIVNDNSIKNIQYKYLSLEKILKNTILDKKIDIKMIASYQNLINELITLMKNNTSNKDIAKNNYDNTKNKQENISFNKLLMNNFVSNINITNNIDNDDDINATNYYDEIVALLDTNDNNKTIAVLDINNSNKNVKVKSYWDKIINKKKELADSNNTDSNNTDLNNTDLNNTDSNNTEINNKDDNISEIEVVDNNILKKDNLAAKVDTNTSNNKDKTIIFKHGSKRYNVNTKPSVNDNESNATRSKSKLDNKVNGVLIIKNKISNVYIESDNKKSIVINMKDIFAVENDINATISKSIVYLSNINNIITANINNNVMVLFRNNNNNGSAIIKVEAKYNKQTAINIFKVMISADYDNDFIPNYIEDYIGSNKFNNDENNNSILDGQESSLTDLGDQFFEKQWYIKSLGNQVNPYESSITIKGNDIGLMDIYHKYMGYNKGNPIVVQVVDTGVDVNHEDLKDNMDFNLSRNSMNGTMGNPIETSTHGTMCAGIIGARAFNGKGIRGIAPFIKIAGSNWIGDGTLSELEEVWIKNDPDGKIAISSNSWANVFKIETSQDFEHFMRYGSNNLRKVDGKVYGKLFVKSAGDGRNINYDSGLSYISSNPYVITVASITNKNKYSIKSSPGSNILVSAYGGNDYNNSATIATTTVSGKTNYPTWYEDINNNYTYAMKGTSAATSIVSGSLALVLEACPTLSWRDVKYLIAKTAIKIDKENDTWRTNSTGLHHSIDYGFGLINPKEMIVQCKSDNFINLPDYSNQSESFGIKDIVIQDNDDEGIIVDFTTTIDQTIEWIGLTIYSDHEYAGDLEIYLTSPSGITTRLMLGNNKIKHSLKDGFRYGSVAFMDENSEGIWTLKVIDKEENKKIKFEKLNFEVFGH